MVKFVKPWSRGVCPNCKIRIERYHNYCSQCGTKLDWTFIEKIEEIEKLECFYEDTDDGCQRYGGYCKNERCKNNCIPTTKRNRLKYKIEEEFVKATKNDDKI